MMMPHQAHQGGSRARYTLMPMMYTSRELKLNPHPGVEHGQRAGGVTHAHTHRSRCDARRGQVTQHSQHATQPGLSPIETSHPQDLRTGSAPNADRRAARNTLSAPQSRNVTTLDPLASSSEWRPRRCLPTLACVRTPIYMPWMSKVLSKLSAMSSKKYVFAPASTSEANSSHLISPSLFLSHKSRIVSTTASSIWPRVWPV